MTLLPARVWSQEQWERIKRGYQARDMDEKWDVFVENRVAFLHRSWTGNGVFEASFSPAGDGWHISAAQTSSERAHGLRGAQPGPARAGAQHDRRR
jgi:hypothetical protein